MSWVNRILRDHFSYTGWKHVRWDEVPADDGSGKSLVSIVPAGTSYHPILCFSVMNGQSPVRCYRLEGMIDILRLFPWPPHVVRRTRGREVIQIERSEVAKGAKWPQPDDNNSNVIFLYSCRYPSLVEPAGSDGGREWRVEWIMIRWNFYYIIIIFFQL